MEITPKIEICYDPLRLKVGGRMVCVDLGAQKLFAAEKEGRRIAVEVKSFLSPFPVKDLEQALGQYILYARVLSIQQAIACCIWRFLRAYSLIFFPRSCRS